MGKIKMLKDKCLTEREYKCERRKVFLKNVLKLILRIVVLGLIAFALFRLGFALFRMFK